MTTTVTTVSTSVTTLVTAVRSAATATTVSAAVTTLVTSVTTTVVTALATVDAVVSVSSSVRHLDFYEIKIVKSYQVSNLQTEVKKSHAVKKCVESVKTPELSPGSDAVIFQNKTVVT